MSIADERIPRAHDLDAIAQMKHVRSFQLTTERRGDKVACGWRAIANDRRYEAGMEPGDSIADLVARAVVQLEALADGSPSTDLKETTGQRIH